MRSLCKRPGFKPFLWLFYIFSAIFVCYTYTSKKVIKLKVFVCKGKGESSQVHKKTILSYVYKYYNIYCIQHQYIDLSLFKIAIIVLKIVFRSNPILQLLIYCVSNFTTSSKSRLLITLFIILISDNTRSKIKFKHFSISKFVIFSYTLPYSLQ